MLKSLSLLSLTIGGLFALSGCASTNEIELGNKKYTPDADGTVVMTQEEIAAITKSEEAKFVRGQFPNVKLTEAEYELVKTNDEALFSLVGEANSDEAVSTFIRRGSLEDNLSRIVKENRWEALYFDGPDYFVKDMKVLEEENVTGAIMSLASDYPVYTCFDEKEKVVTVIKER